MRSTSISAPTYLKTSATWVGTTVALVGGAPTGIN